MKPETQTSKKFKCNDNAKFTELDGFRGLAIIIIILSHFENTIFQSGGVNIFFVLSGFFIAKIIFDKGDSFNIINFYKARFLSLYPTLIATSLIAIIIYIIFGEFEKSPIYLKSLFASLSSQMNFYLISQNNNYSNQLYLNIFMPLWAFSIIFQYYLLYPIFIKILKFITKTHILLELHILLVFSTVCFFAANIYLSYFGYIDHFYSTISRIWQFLLGASILYMSHHYKPRLNLPFLELATMLIIFWQLDFDIFNNFYLKTLIITTSAGLFIFGVLWQVSPLKKFYSNRILTKIGILSYPIYLLHLPFIYIFSLYFVGVSSIFLSLICIFIGGVVINTIIKKNLLSYLAKNNKARSLVLVLCLCVVSFSYFVDSNKKFFSILHSNFEGLLVDYNIKNKLSEKISYYGFHREILKDSRNQNCERKQQNFKCTFNLDGKNKNVVLLGTSHLSMISKKLVDDLVKRDHPVTVITSPGCPYMLDFYHINRPWCNSSHMNEIRKYLSLIEKKTVVVYLSYYSYYINSGQTGDFDTSPDFQIMRSKHSKDVAQGFRETLVDILNLSHELLLIYPIPDSDKNIPRELQRANSNLNIPMLINFKKFKSRNWSTFKMLNSIQGKNISRFYPHELLCDVSRNFCKTTEGKKILYTDSNHLSNFGASLIVRGLIKSPAFLN